MFKCLRSLCCSKDDSLPPPYSPIPLHEFNNKCLKKLFTIPFIPLLYIGHDDLIILNSPQLVVKVLLKYGIPRHTNLFMIIQNDILNSC